jgi:hypothetical protein
MKTIYISRINHSRTRTSLFGKQITEYDTYEGVVKEICPRSGDKAPKYVLKRTKEPINVIII